jgi:sirohydrochlorin ferrochelatase
MTALIVFAHGSTVAAANQSIHDLAARVAAGSGYVSEAAFLEIAEPDLPRAVKSLAERGVSRIVVLPYFLAPGRHAERDLPRIIQELQGIYKAVKIEAAANLDGHPSLVGILLDRAAAVLEEH